MTYAVIVPYAYQPYFDEFKATLKIPEENCLFVDDTNPVGGIGIMKAHNMGVEFARSKNADFLIVMSAGIRFGEAGGLDFIEILESRPDTFILHGEGRWTDPGTGEEKIQALGWHLTAFRTEIFDKVGGWDENFSPYSLDDTDLTLRMLKGFPDRYKVETVPCDMSHSSTSHSITKAGVKAGYHPRNSYFTRKWGRDGGEWQSNGYPTPFNLPDKPLSYCPDKDDPLSIWQNEYSIGGYNYYE
jgi:hypothetical protein